MRIRSRGRLPHWEADQGVYFVTFRLHDSLPRRVVQAFQEERKNIVATAKAMGRDLSPSERSRLANVFSEKIERYLNAGLGACHLRNRKIANEVVAALRYFDGRRYRLFARCVMPNHVHVVFQAEPGYGLSEILHAWKSFTSKKANRLLRRTGQFWQREYYDHLIRYPDEFDRIVGYVAKNPQQAGLKNWPWVEICS